MLKQLFRYLQEETKNVFIKRSNLFRHIKRISATHFPSTYVPNKILEYFYIKLLSRFKTGVVPHIGSEILSKKLEIFNIYWAISDFAKVCLHKEQFRIKRILPQFWFHFCDTSDCFIAVQCQDFSQT